MAPDKFLANVDDLLLQLPDIVQRERRNRGISLNKAAKQMGISNYMLSCIERRVRQPTLPKVRLIIQWIAYSES